LWGGWDELSARCRFATGCTGYLVAVPYWISGDLLIRSRNSPPKEAEAYDWVTRAWRPIADTAIRHVDQSSWRALTRVDVEALVAEP
jgi:hypothetical protein